MQTGRRLPRKRRKLLLTISSDLPAFSPFTYIHTVAVTPVHIVREAYKYKSDSPFSEAELRMQPRGLFVKRIFSGEHAGQRVLRVELIPNKNMWNIFTEQTSEPHTSSLHIIAKRPHVYRIPFVGHCPTRFLFSFQIARQVFRDKLPSGERPISSSYYVPAFLHLRTDSFLFRAYVRLSLFFFLFVDSCLARYSGKYLW